jgi:hypothetical protein
MSALHIPIASAKAVQVREETERLFINTEGRRGVVILVQPFLWEARAKNRTKFTESLALGYLTGALKAAGYGVLALNAEQHRWTDDEVVRRIVAAEDAVLVGFSVKSERAYRSARNIAAGVKAARPDLHLTIGGVLATSADSQVLEDCPHFDSTCRGEGEFLITELAYRILYRQPLAGMRGVTCRLPDGRIVRGENRPRVRDLDKLPRPFRNEMEEGDSSALQSAYMVTSRGCFAACTFCSIHQIYGDRDVARRSPQNVVDEMEALVRDYGVRRFSFVDDLFIMPSPKGLRWLDEFCALLEQKQLGIKFYAEMRADTVTVERIRRLQGVGMHRLFIGIESGSDSVLLRWDKGVKVEHNNAALRELERAGLARNQVNFGYIMFDAEMTYAELKENYYWLKHSGYCLPQHLQNRMNIYVGTPTYDRMLQKFGLQPPKFGERWLYKFFDDDVGSVEAALRGIHERLQNELLEDYIVCNETYRRQLNVFGESSQHFTGDFREALNAVHRHLGGLERALYYRIFDDTFAYIDDGRPHSEEAHRERLHAAIVQDAAELCRRARALTAMLEHPADVQFRSDATATRICAMTLNGTRFEVYLDCPITDRFSAQVTFQQAHDAPAV